MMKCKNIASAKTLCCLQY